MKDERMREQLTSGIFASEGVTRSDRVLHTPGNFAKKYLLYVQEAGTLESLTPHICRRKNLDSYLIFEVLDGKGSITYEDRSYELHPGECIWIDCQQEFTHISSREMPWRLAWIHFNGNCAGEFYSLFRERHDSPVFLPADAGEIRRLLEQVLRGVKEHVKELDIHSLLTQLAAACIRQASEKDMLRDAREYINANFKEQKLPQLLEQRFAVSAGELEALFLDSFGIGLRDYILNRRFNAAKEQLRFSILPVTEVIRESGIGNEDLFYRLFQEYENMCPQEYREKWAQWMKD
ncbi:MAG: AraC family transcriptional regulator [Eubacterium sp.]|nr:AraC family transcriptional regulator [Eubacterium sp.]